jgi:CRP-like cAMP-binding protein
MSEDFSGLFAGKTDVVNLGAGETLFKRGEPARLMVDGARRSATVRALVPSTVIPVDERQFLFMVQQTPFFALRVMRVLTARVRAMNERAKALR